MSIKAVDILECYPFNQIIITSPVLLIDPEICEGAISYYTNLSTNSKYIKGLLANLNDLDIKAATLKKQFKVLKTFYFLLKESLMPFFESELGEKYIQIIFLSLKNLLQITENIKQKMIDYKISFYNLLDFISDKREFMVTESNRVYDSLYEQEGFYEWSQSNELFTNTYLEFIKDIEIIDKALDQEQTLTDKEDFLCNLYGTIEGLIKYKTQLFFLLSQIQQKSESKHYKDFYSNSNIVGQICSSLGRTDNFLTKQIGEFQKIASEADIVN